MWNKVYTAYISRDGIEHEVLAELYADGETSSDSWADTGHTIVIEKDPVFHKFLCDDLELTTEELDLVVKQLIEQYWDSF